MSAKSLHDLIEKQRPFILYSELLGLLHDIGKLSNGFYDYRQRWKADTDGWNKDPHDHEFFQFPRDKKSYGNYEGDNGALDKYPDLRKCFGVPPVFAATPSVIPVTTVICAAHTHVDPKCDLIKILSLADKVDSAQDRNNPLFSADQTAVAGKIFDTDVFGAENDETKVDITDFEKRRMSLYEKLNKFLPQYYNRFNYEDRKQVLAAIRDAAHVGAFSDTTRPNNDTSLWEHSYAVASIFKVILVHEIICNERFDDFKNVRFSILGIGWDGLAYMSTGHKIGDVVGRQRTIKDLREAIKELVEHKYPIGNSIYEDDNGIYFIVPAVEDFSFDKPVKNRRDYEDILIELRNEILESAKTVTDGDIFPHLYITPETRFMTTLVSCIKHVEKMVKTPIGASVPEEWLKWTDASDETVCPLCRKRPVVSKVRDICDICDKRRVKSVVEMGDGTNTSQETPFISEIVKASGKSNKACLIVAKLGINDWLDGKMIRSLFIKQANILDMEVGDLTRIEQIAVKMEEKKTKTWHDVKKPHVPDGYTYDLIKKEIALCRDYTSLSVSTTDKKYAENIIFLYNRRIIRDGQSNNDPGRFKGDWEPFLNAAKEEYADSHHLSDNELLCNIVCAKMPTPSTVLDVWGATDDFLNGLRNPLKLIDGEKPQGQRIKCKIDKPKHVKIGLIYEGRIGNEAVEVAWLSKNSDEAWIIGGYEEKKALKAWKEETVLLKGNPFGGNDEVRVVIQEKSIQPMSYLPCRTITATPDLFMAIVPADYAVDITKKIHEGYTKRFSKVVGRLPLSIGHIFFKDKMPMFVVLDSARRMVNGFEKNEAVGVTVLKDVEENGHKKFVVNWEKAGYALPIRWSLPYKLGDGTSDDWHHPYFIVESGDKLAERKTYFKTVAGDVVHFSHIKKSDVIKAYLNRYDYVFLDSTARRYEIGATPARRLEDLEQGMEYLWKMICKTPGMTDTRLCNVEGLLRTKFDEWCASIDDKNSKAYSEAFSQWTNLVDTTMKLKFKGVNVADGEFLTQAVLSGLFFDCLEFYLRILKQRISDKED